MPHLFYAVCLRFISIFGICEEVWHFSQHSHNVTINSHYSQLRLHTDSHASDSGAVERKRRTILDTQAKPLHIQMSLSRKPFGIGHVFIQSLLLRMTDTMTSQNIDLSSWNTLYINSTNIPPIMIINRTHETAFQPIQTSGRQWESMTIPSAAHTVL